MLYHYTNANALQNIIQYSSLWLTHVRYMNDNDELFGGLDKIIAQRDRKIKIDTCFEALKQKYGGMSEERLWADAALEVDQREKLLRSDVGYGPLSAIESFKNNVCMFVCSFCQTGDLLSQWRGYASDDIGYCIEFDEELIKHALENYECSNKIRTSGILDCIYIDDKKEELIDKVSSELKEEKIETETLVEDDLLDVLDLELASDESAQEVVDLFSGSVYTVSYEKVPVVFSKALMTAVKLKNKSFIEENEKRLVIDTDGYDSEQIKHRNRAGVILPYIPFKFDKRAVKSITVGPHHHSKLASEGLKLFLKGIYSEEEMPEVIESDIPLRR